MRVIKKIQLKSVKFLSVHLVCECDGKIVEERDVVFNLGEGIEAGVPQGIEKALEKFKLKEKSQLELKSKYAWGKEGRPELNVPPNADLVYTITLNNFEKVRNAAFYQYILIYLKINYVFVNVVAFNLAMLTILISEE